MDHFEEQMKVIVERDGVETEIKYWPRKFRDGEELADSQIR